MNKHVAWQLLCLLALAVTVGAKIGTREQVLAAGVNAVNKWLGSNQLGCGWEDGTLMIGVSILHEATGDPSLQQAMLAFGNRHNWNLCVQLNGGAAHADNQICAATYAEAYISSGGKNNTWLRAAVEQLNAEMHSPTSVRNWFWVDALFMAMSVYARIGAITQNPAYFDKMHQNFVYAALTPHPNGFGFWSKTDKLFYRDPPKGSPNGVFWSRGNGWAAAALVQAMKYSAVNDRHVGTYRAIYKQQMDRLVQLQGADGCWRSSLTDPEYYSTPETTGTALFTYAMAYGISEGILDAETFRPVVDKAWECLTTVSLHADGSIGNCQPVGYAPRPDFGRDTTSSFCVGQFAMAAAGMAQLGA